MRRYMRIDTAVVGAVDRPVPLPRRPQTSSPACPLSSHAASSTCFVPIDPPRQQQQQQPAPAAPRRRLPAVPRQQESGGGGDRRAAPASPDVVLRQHVPRLAPASRPDSGIGAADLGVAAASAAAAAAAAAAAGRRDSWHSVQQSPPGQ